MTKSIVPITMEIKLKILSRTDWFFVWTLDGVFFLVEMKTFQVYDDYWKPASVCEDYSRIRIPVLAIGGWHDMYSNAVFRLVDNLPKCRGLIGPWSHDWPDVALPGPQVRNIRQLGMGFSYVTLIRKYVTSFSNWPSSSTICHNKSNMLMV